MNRKHMWFALSKVPGLESHHIKKILNCVGDIDVLFQMRKNDLQKTLERLRVPERIVAPLLVVREFDYSSEYHRLEQDGIQFIAKEDEEYPNRLKVIPDAPFYLYSKGCLPSEDMPSLAVIGARNCSIYGQEIAQCFCKVLAGNGVQIISGMARGIDGYAHKGALETGYTCGVLGFGMDICYPNEHIRLKKKLEEKGGLVSEYPMGTPGLSKNFPARNRLIAGLSDAVFVIEAAKKSGTLITVDFALEQGKMVYAVPGRIGDRLSEGCNEIIKEGAKIVTNPEDILSEFHLKLQKWLPEGMNQNEKIVLERQEKIVYACLDLEPRHIEQIVLSTGMLQEDVLPVLMRLEMKGYVRQPVKNYYVKNISSICI